MARNDDRARKRRDKRRGEDPEATPPEDSLTPEPEEELEGFEGVSEIVRAEQEARDQFTGSPVGFGAPTSDDRPHSELDPTEGGHIVGGEKTGAGRFRLLRFFRASWQELQRVRWPDREQVGQGTLVTLGFVVVAGVYLGLSDVLARQIVNFLI